MLFLTAVLAVGFLGVIFWSSSPAEANRNAELLVKQENSQYVLNTESLGDFHRTSNSVSNQKLIQVGNGSSVQIAVWEENSSAGKTSHYAISLDGKTVQRVTEADNAVMLRYGKFDPLVETPSVPSELASRGSVGEAAYIVQFATQSLEAYRQQISDLGGKIYTPVPNNAHIVIMNEDTRAGVASLPFVRWVGRYEPAYKMEEFLNEKLMSDAELPTMRYNIMALERGMGMQGSLAETVRSLGGKVEMTIPQGYRMEATLNEQQLLAIANKNEVLFIDRWSAPESDMDIVRSTGGADFIQTTLGFKGEGVRAEVMDGGLMTTHTDFVSGLTPILHGAVSNNDHGTATYGINFGRGTTNPLARGLIPEAQGIFAGYPALTNRYTHTARLSQDPYKAVFQTNSWGSAQVTTYTTVSAEMDDILFLNDITILQSQSNTGNQTSRPQAWAKNIVSVGGISHFNTATFADDRWTSASIGPAADGRLKPELAHFYDNVTTTYTTTSTGYGTFSGTSAATPITAGHFGIFYQMWHNGLFNNSTAGNVFDSRPHMTTAKAIMVNTAVQWDMAQVNRERNKQGFGRVDLTNLYNLRNKMMIVNETDVLTNLQTKSYTIKVPAGSADPLKVTMVYNDPKGNPGATRTRINDLSLKVTAPNGTIYWGNNGLNAGMWSTSGGSANIVDTVENVFVQTPQAGNWTVEVIASEIVQDARAETASVVDADYALVASGVERVAAPLTRFDYDADGKADLSVYRPGNGTWYLQQSTAGFTAVPFGLSTDLIAPEDFDGDGKTDIAVFRSGAWYIQQSSAGFTSVSFGTAGDIPMPGDFDGDNKADVAVFRASNNTWYINGSTAGFSATTFGSAGDKPVAGDYDGDGKTDIAVFRPSNGTWYLLRSQAGFTAVAFGVSGDKLVPADYDGDSKTDVAVFRNGNWYIQRSQAGFISYGFGLGTDTPVAADYDGDAKADPAVYRDGSWYLLQSTAGFTAASFGQANDKPTEAAYNQ